LELFNLNVLLEISEIFYWADFVIPEMFNILKLYGISSTKMEKIYFSGRCNILYQEK